MVCSVGKVFISRTLVVTSAHRYYIILAILCRDRLCVDGEYQSLVGEGGMNGLNKSTLTYLLVVSSIRIINYAHHVFFLGAHQIFCLPNFRIPCASKKNDIRRSSSG